MKVTREELKQIIEEEVKRRKLAEAKSAAVFKDPAVQRAMNFVVAAINRASGLSLNVDAIEGAIQGSLSDYFE